MISFGRLFASQSFQQRPVDVNALPGTGMHFEMRADQLITARNQCSPRCRIEHRGESPDLQERKIRNVTAVLRALHCNADHRGRRMLTNAPLARSAAASFTPFYSNGDRASRCDGTRLLEHCNSEPSAY